MMTLDRRGSSQTPLAKEGESPVKPRRPYWTPTRFEIFVGLLLGAAWFIGMVVAIGHEGVGFFLAAVYLVMGVLGWVVTWLLVWPLMRMIGRGP